jgi:hypothetical protein
LRKIGQDPHIDYSVTLERIYRETCNHLDSLAAHVGEGKNVLEASLFVRWLEFSGVMRLLSHHAVPGQDFSALPAKVESMHDLCRPHLQGQRVEKSYRESDIVEIKTMLEKLVAAVARPAVVTAVTTNGVKSINGDLVNNRFRLSQRS